MPIEWSSMNCGDAYILDVGEAFFVWQGRECSRTEKLKVCSCFKNNIISFKFMCRLGFLKNINYYKKMKKNGGKVVRIYVTVISHRNYKNNLV